MINFKSGLIYCISTSIMLPACIILIILSAIYGNAFNIISFTLFGTSLFLLFLFNTLYYWIPNKTASMVFFKLKNIFSYIFISSSITCICFSLLLGPWGWSIFGVVWGLSVLGIIFSSVWANIPNIIIVFSRIIISSILFIALKPLVVSFSNITTFGLLMFFLCFFLYLISGIFKLSNNNYLKFISIIFSILGATASYIFLINYLI